MNVALRTGVVLLFAWLGWLTLLGAPTTVVTKEVATAAIFTAVVFSLFGSLFGLEDPSDIWEMAIFGALVLWITASLLPAYVSTGDFWMTVLCGACIGAAQWPTSVVIKRPPVDKPR